MIKRFLFALLFLLFTSPVFGAQLTISWTDNSTNEDGFKIDRKLGQTGTFANVATLGPDVTTYVDTTPDDQLYCYRVLAFNAAGDSPWSNEACGTALTPPLAPSEATVTIVITITVP